MLPTELLQLAAKLFWILIPWMPKVQVARYVEQELLEEWEVSILETQVMGINAATANLVLGFAVNYDEIVSLER